MGPALARRRSGPRTGGGPRCASTSTRGSAPTGLPERAASGPEAPRSPCSSLGDDLTRPPQGFVGFVGDLRASPLWRRAGGKRSQTGHVTRARLCEPRYIAPIIEGAIGDGLRVEVRP